MAQTLPGGPAAPMPPLSPPEPIPEPAQDEEPVIDPIAAAEKYALIYPERAALIRRAGRVPDNAAFGRPEAWFARAGHGPNRHFAGARPGGGRSTRG